MLNCFPELGGTKLREAMKVLFSTSFILIFLLLLGLNKMEARRSAEEYWRHVMGEQPIPEAIAGLLVSNKDDHQEGKDPAHRRYGGDSSPVGRQNWDRWINRDFDTRSVAIIYHQHDDHSRRMIPRDRRHHQVEHHGDDHAS